VTVAIITETGTMGRLIIGDPPASAPLCSRCHPARASIILNHTCPLCKACLIDLVERGLKADQ